MSKPRYWWWAAVRMAIRQYPALAAKKVDLQAMQVTRAVRSIRGTDGKLRDLYAIPGSSGDGRTTEELALRKLSPAEEAILEAVQTAFERTALDRDGAEHVAMLKDYYFQRLSLQAAADRAHIDYKTAQRWNGAFARKVARGLGYLPAERDES